MADFYGDVVYEVWNQGGNPDLVDRDRCSEHKQNGFDAWEAASIELRYQRSARERDLREWEANEWDLPDDERFSR